MTVTEQFTATVGPAVASNTPPPLQLTAEDEAAFTRELTALDMTDAQARELLGILVWMMGFFVEHGFSGDICGQILHTALANDSHDSASVKLAIDAARDGSRGD